MEHGYLSSEDEKADARSLLIILGLFIVLLSIFMILDIAPALSQMIIGAVGDNLTPSMENIRNRYDDPKYLATFCTLFVLVPTFSVLMSFALETPPKKLSTFLKSKGKVYKTLFFLLVPLVCFGILAEFPRHPETNGIFTVIESLVYSGTGGYLIGITLIGTLSMVLFWAFICLVKHLIK